MLIDDPSASINNSLNLLLGINKLNVRLLSDIEITEDTLISYQPIIVSGKITEYTKTNISYYKISGVLKGSINLRDSFIYGYKNKVTILPKNKSSIYFMSTDLYEFVPVFIVDPFSIELSVDNVVGEVDKVDGNSIPNTIPISPVPITPVQVNVPYINGYDLIGRVKSLENLVNILVDNFNNHTHISITSGGPTSTPNKFISNKINKIIDKITNFLKI